MSERTVFQSMSRKHVVSLGATATVWEAACLMTGANCGSVLIVEPPGKLLGIVTDGDIRRHAGKNIDQRKASEVMTSGPKVAGPDQLAAEALALMTEKKITQLFVLEAGSPKPLGVIHIHDCVAAGIA